jgi:hypothetical protein
MDQDRIVNDSTGEVNEDEQSGEHGELGDLVPQELLLERGGTSAG